MRVRTRLIAALAAGALLLPTAAIAGPGHPDRPASVHGLDGVTYDSAPVVVPGQDGQLFYGPSLDVACGLGTRFARAASQLTRLARVIERSGRRVVYTMAPDKSNVMPRLLPSQLPHGTCDSQGLADVDHVLDKLQDAAYLPLRRPLMASRHEVFWKTDPHWTTVGGSVFAKELATRLNPSLGRHQHYAYGSLTAVGMLDALQGLATPETIETALPRGPVQVEPVRGEAAWTCYPEVITDYSWTSRPSRLTWPGRTVLIGDSFTWFALGSLLPLFRHGRFVWLTADLRTMARAMKQADTVVFEVFSTFTPGSVIGSAHFRSVVKHVLAVTKK